MTRGFPVNSPLGVVIHKLANVKVYSPVKSMNNYGLTMCPRSKLCPSIELLRQDDRRDEYQQAGDRSSDAQCERSQVAALNVGR